MLFSGAIALPAPAQQVLVQNGATVEVANGGALDLQGSAMDFGPVGTTNQLSETSKGRVTGGLLTADRALNSPSQADPAGLGAMLSASVDLGEVTITRGHTVQTASNGNESIRRYYDIVPSQNNSDLSATLTHTYADAELNGLSESDLELFKSEDGGSTWSEEGVDSRDASTNEVTLSGIESFSRWTLGSSSSPLPVELASFEATTEEASGADEVEAVTLSWTTASEQNNAGFEIQRRSGGEHPDAASWRKVGFTESRAAGGTTGEATTYRFTDENLPYAADTLSYRLRQVDIDGTATLSGPVRIARDAVSELQLKETYPNPARHRVTVRFAVPSGQASDSEATLRLYDVLGRVVQTVRTEATADRHELQVSVQDLASGVYVLRLAAGNEPVTRKLTVVR